jgi:protocatechuate 3,4-dioxygenase beta subunit
MRNILLLLFNLLILICNSYAQTSKDRLIKYEQALIEHPNDYKNYESLSFLVSQHYLELSSSDRLHIRKTLATHTRFSNIHLNPPGEAGIPITIHGTVYNPEGVALKNVPLFIFHTDANGYYAPDDPIKNTMNEPDARLFGYMTTDDLGGYSFTTIQPGTYPKKYQGRFIPQHIHFEIQYPGYKSFSIQMAFEDDPAMKDVYWKKWAEGLHYPVIRLVKNNRGLNGKYDIRLEKK